MKLYTLFIAAGLLAACDNTPPPPSSPKAAENQNEQSLPSEEAKEDAEFLVKLADGNMVEIEMGELAKTHGKSRKVIDFGTMMVDHHSQMLADLKTLAASKNVKLPTDLCEDSREKVNDLAKKHGEDFDKGYVNEMLSDHKKDIKGFEDKLKDEECAADVKTFLTEGLPVLQRHMNAITEIKKSGI